MTARRRVAVLLALAGASLACRGDAASEADTASVLAFRTARIRLVAAETLRIHVQLAESEAQHGLGLMERRQLADSAGMLFLYSSDQPESAAFWMFRTRIPLDIAFMDSGGVIHAIKQMAPCPTDFAQGCPSYPPGVSYRSAIEMNAGYFARHGVKVGDRFILSDTSIANPRSTRQPSAGSTDHR